MTPTPDTASLREKVARIVDHEGCWTRLDALNGAIRLGLATDEQHLELCNARDEEISATECSLDTADAIIALFQTVEPRLSISRDGPHKPDKHRLWLARQLLDSKLTDAEAYSVVADFPPVSDTRERATVEEPPASVGEALASLEGAIRAAGKGAFPYQGQYDALDDMEGLAHTLERHRTEPFFWLAPIGRDGT